MFEAVDVAAGVMAGMRNSAYTTEKASLLSCRRVPMRAVRFLFHVLVYMRGNMVLDMVVTSNELSFVSYTLPRPRSIQRTVVVVALVLAAYPPTGASLMSRSVGTGFVETVEVAIGITCGLLVACVEVGVVLVEGRLMGVKVPSGLLVFVAGVIGAREEKYQ